MNAWQNLCNWVIEIPTLDFYSSMAGLKNGRYHITAIQKYNQQFNHMQTKKKHPVQNCIPALKYRI